MATDISIPGSDSDTGIDMCQEATAQNNSQKFPMHVAMIQQLLVMNKHVGCVIWLCDDL